MPTPKYTVAQFNREFPTESSCLKAVFSARFGSLARCPSCGRPATFHRLAGRKAWACSRCGYQLHPLAGTVFRKSSTPLRLWFFALFLFSSSKNGVSAKELERQLGVTYKTAWRMAHQIRTLFAERGSLLSGTIEMDESYFGGKSKEKGRSTARKGAVVGMVERKGAVAARHTDDVSRWRLHRELKGHAKPGSTVVTDDFHGYRYLERAGYAHRSVKHSRRQYGRGEAHTNTVEGYWSLVKRSIRGTHVWVSKKWLQSYLDEFSWRYNRREASASLFSLLLAEAVTPRG